MPHDILADLHRRNIAATREILDADIERQARLGGPPDTWERAIFQRNLLSRLERELARWEVFPEE